MLKAGFAKIDITPEFGIQIPGYFGIRPADGIIDPLYARAVVLDDGICPLAFVVMDILHVSAASTKMIRDRVSAATEIPHDNIMVGATHIHTGSSTDRRTEAPGSWDEANIVLTAKKTADAVITAWNKREDAKIGYGSKDEHNVAFNRRYYMKDGTLKTNPGVLNPDIDRVAAPIDPQVGVLRVDYADGRPMGTVINYAVHPDVVGGTKFCADYIGELSRTLKKIYGDDFGVVYMNGCCGDLNHIDALGGTNLPLGKQHLRMGKMLAGDAMNVFEFTQTSDNVTLGTASTIFHGTRRRVSDADYAWALKAKDDENLSAVDRYYARVWTEMYEDPIPDPDIEVQSCSIKWNDPLKNGTVPGDLAISSLPGEIFVEIGLELKAKSPFANVMICELANGYYGYISTKKGIEDGGYETRIHKSTNMDKETAPQLIENQLKLMNMLKK